MWALIDVSKKGIGASETAKRVLGLYPTEREAMVAQGDWWDCSGSQDFKIVDVGLVKDTPEEQEPERYEPADYEPDYDRMYDKYLEERGERHTRGQDEM